MSYIGVTIDNTNTLTEYGLALLSDVSIGAPEPRTTYVTVPEADGDLDLTGALTGGVVRYGMRQISFSLYPVRDAILGTDKVPNERNAGIIRQRLAAFIHGQERKLYLPDAPGYYFQGRMAIGEKSGYNGLRIPVTMMAQPWRINPNFTKTISTPGTVTIENPGPATTPTFIAFADNSALFTFNGTTYTVNEGETTFDGVVFQNGTNTLNFLAVGRAFQIKYNEAVL